MKDFTSIRCFNSCPHAEGNLHGRALQEVEKLKFQFVPSRGGQPGRPQSMPRKSLFQFVPSRGGQLEMIVLFLRATCFNSCPHAEGNVKQGS